MIHISQSYSRISDLTRIIKHKLKNDYFKIWILNEFMKQNYYPLDLIKQIFLMAYQSIQMSATSNHIMVRMNRTHILCNVSSQYHHIIYDILKFDIKKIFFIDWEIITLDNDEKMLLRKYDLKKEPILVLENIKNMKYRIGQNDYITFHILTNDLMLLSYVVSPTELSSGKLESYFHLQKLRVKMTDILLIEYNVHSVFVLTKNGELYESGHGSDNIPSQINISGQVIDIKCGWAHNVVLTKDYNVYVWGANGKNQLGLKSTHYYTPQKLNVKNIISMCCYGDYTLLLSIDGSIYSYGDIDS